MLFKKLSRLLPVFSLILLSACSHHDPVNTVCRHPAAASPVCTYSQLPSFENRLETEHFILKWTNVSPHSEDNICDPEIVKETAGYFEASWDKLTGLFGRTPYVAPESGKIEVIFHNLDCYAYADPPEGPIELNASVWARVPSIRQSTCAHELFHKLQYAYGFKTRWAPDGSILWFTEGTASWAEVFVCGRVTRNCKMEDMFKDTSINLYEADDMALPFWIYFVSGNRGTPKDRLMVRFFEEYEKSGNVNQALCDVIRDAYGSVDSFFLRFAMERRNAFWRDAAPGSCPYSSITGPDGKDLVAEIREYQNRNESRPPGSTRVQ
jgi:hypothetical protein